MSLDTPTTQQINDNIIAQLEASLNQSIPLLPKSFLRVLARALSGVFILLYKYAGFMHLQQFAQYASFKETTVNGVTLIPLVEWGRLVGLGDPTRATAAEILITVTVEQQGGGLPVGSQLVNPVTGVTYITTGSLQLDAPVVTVRAVAASDKSGGDGLGSVGNMQPGQAITFANPLAGVSRNATVSEQLVTGSAAETEQAYRQRVLDRFQKRPQGGAYADYEQWGEEAAGILNIYPYTSPYPGQVDLYVEATPESSGNADGVPTSAQLQSVLESVNLDTSGLASRRPAGALVNAYPIRRLGFYTVVTGLQVDDIVGARADITAAMRDYLANREPYIPGLSVPPRRDRITRSALGGAIDDIVSAYGGIFSEVTLFTGGASIDVYILGEGEKSKLEGVTFE